MPPPFRGRNFVGRLRPRPQGCNLAGGRSGVGEAAFPPPRSRVDRRHAQTPQGRSARRADRPDLVEPGRRSPVSRRRVGRRPGGAGQVPAAPPAGPRGLRGGLRGDRHPDRAAGGHQAAARLAVGQPDGPQGLPDGGPRRRPARAPQPRRRLRHRAARRPLLHRHATRAGRQLSGTPPPQRAVPLGSGRPHHRRGVLRAGTRPRRGDRPPRHQAGQHPARRRRDREAGGLRPGPGPRARPVGGGIGVDGGGHSAVHEPRAVPRRTAGRPQRRVLVGRDVLRPADGDLAVRRSGRHAGDPLRPLPPSRSRPEGVDRRTAGRQLADHRHGHGQGPGPALSRGRRDAGRPGAAVGRGRGADERGAGGADGAAPAFRAAAPSPARAAADADRRGGGGFGRAGLGRRGGGAGIVGFRAPGREGRQTPDDRDPGPGQTAPARAAAPRPALRRAARRTGPAEVRGLGGDGRPRLAAGARRPQGRRRAGCGARPCG